MNFILHSNQKIICCVFITIHKKKRCNRNGIWIYQPHICSMNLLHVLMHNQKCLAKIPKIWFYSVLSNKIDPSIQFYSPSLYNYTSIFLFHILGLYEATRIYCHWMAIKTHCWRILVTCIWSRVFSCCGFMSTTTKFGLYYLMHAQFLFPHTHTNCITHQFFNTSKSVTILVVKIKITLNLHLNRLEWKNELQSMQKWT